MNKCDCYHIQPTIKYKDDCIPFMAHDGVCWGTREQDICSCGGDRTKCDFYPEVRERALEEMDPEFMKPEFGEWVSVKDRLPEDKSKCLIWTTIYFIPDHNDDTNHYDSYEVSTYYTEYGFVSHNGMCAKYWMPLPEPPKGE